MRTDDDFARGYDQEIFRSKIYSALWALIAEKKKAGFRLSDLAARLGKDKGYISRLFSQQENCKLNTISDLAHALDAGIHIEVVDRASGRHYGVNGPHKHSASSRSFVKKSYVFEEGDQEMQVSIKQR